MSAAEVFVLLTTEVSGVESEWTRREFATISEALAVARRHVRGRRKRSAEIWLGEELLLWDTEQRPVTQFFGPRALGCYRFDEEAGEPRWKLRTQGQ